MVVSIDDASAPYIHVYGSTAEILAYLLAQGVPRHRIVAIWDAADGPTNCVYLE